MKFKKTLRPSLGFKGKGSYEERINSTWMNDIRNINLVEKLCYASKKLINSGACNASLHPFLKKLQ